MTRRRDSEISIAWSWIRCDGEARANLRIEDQASRQMIVDVELSPGEVTNLLSSLQLSRIPAFVVPAERAGAVLGKESWNQTLARFHSNTYTRKMVDGNFVTELVSGLCAIGDTKAEVEAEFRAGGWTDFRWDMRNDGSLLLTGWTYGSPEEKAAFKAAPVVEVKAPKSRGDAGGRR